MDTTGPFQRPKQLLSTRNHKTEKGLSAGYLTAGLSLLPSNASGWNLCSHASPGCDAQCINFAGHGRMKTIQRARLGRTRAFMLDRPWFLERLEHEVGLHEKNAKRKKLKPAVRLNVFSDQPWETIVPGLFTSYPDVQFYDYTKVPRRYQRYLDGRLPKNYHLTFSRSEANDLETLDFLSQGGSAAVVLTEPLPKEWCGHQVVDGDATDLRFLDPTRVVVGLTPKGRAMHDETGFVVRDPDEVPLFGGKGCEEALTPLDTMRCHFQGVHEELSLLARMSPRDRQRFMGPADCNAWLDSESDEAAESRSIVDAAQRNSVKNGQTRILSRI